MAGVARMACTTMVEGVQPQLVSSVAELAVIPLNTTVDTSLVVTGDAHLRAVARAPVREMAAEDGLVLGVQLEVVLGQGPQLQLPVGELATVAELAPGREDHDQD